MNRRRSAALMAALWAAACVGAARGQADRPVGRITWVEVSEGSGGDQMTVGKLNTYPTDKDIPWDDKGTTTGKYPKELDDIPALSGVMPYHLIQDSAGKGFVYSAPAGTGGQIGVLLPDISVGQGWTISGEVAGTRAGDALAQGMPASFQTGTDGYFYPAMTRDGKNLFVTKIESITVYKIGWANPLASSPLAVSLLGDGAYATPSPDGKLLAHVDLSRGALQQSLVVTALTPGAPGAPPAPGAAILTIRTTGRVVHPSWRGDGKVVAFSSDGLTPAAWQVFAAQVNPGAPGTTTDLSGSEVTQVSDPDGTWPAYAPDGRAIAYSTMAGNHYALVYMPVDPTGKPTGAGAQPVAGTASSSADCTWASWHQDALPPSVFVQIIPGGDLSRATSVEVHVQADSDPGTVKATVALKGKHFDPKMETDPFGAAADGDVLRAPLQPGADRGRHVHLRQHRRLGPPRPRAPPEHGRGGDLCQGQGALPGAGPQAVAAGAGPGQRIVLSLPHGL